MKYSAEISAFLIGFLVGIQIFLWTFSSSSASFSYPKKFFQLKSIDSFHKYNTLIADKLFNEVKILCLILTQPSNHKTKAYHVNNTWGHKCNRFILLSTENDTKFETFSISRNESRSILWGKVKNGFEQAYLKYYKDYDWFLKGDDDS
jgi:glycoprotein-N-acetylgalactosamine 3-beta-galactosyltransferase